MGGPLTRAPGERMGREELEQFCDLCLKMLEFDPKKRITPQEALAHPFFQGGVTKEINPSLKEESKMEEEEDELRPSTR